MQQECSEYFINSISTSADSGNRSHGYCPTAKASRPLTPINCPSFTIPIHFDSEQSCMASNCAYFYDPRTLQNGDPSPRILPPHDAVTKFTDITALPSGTETRTPRTPKHKTSVESNTLLDFRHNVIHPRTGHPPEPATKIATPQLTSWLSYTSPSQRDRQKTSMPSTA
ncbi:hypothetical protein ACJ73_06684 [Blastomyces percursus]|uniref:Uncharacterized protein n=1 Tax=Blastomyces percursus TaxID=1658174 RepID=A0A1J9Q050_9EURO|nr:hypothetical protein ACJ73_06684 [Blastomyces percursus]